MAKVYQAVRDVSIPRPVGLLDPNKPDGDWVVDGATYPAGSLISEEWMTPRDRERAEKGEFSHLLQPSDQELPEGYVVEGGFTEPERGVFIAEHEAEATALAMGGHVVVPKEQQMELLSSSLPHQREYQEAVREHEFDRRPHVEAMQQIGQARVPDEIIMGGETPTGLPHHRGAPGAQEEALDTNRKSLEEAEDAEEDSTPVAMRPAPRLPGVEGSQENLESSTASEQGNAPRNQGENQQGESQEGHQQQADPQTVKE